MATAAERRAAKTAEINQAALQNPGAVTIDKVAKPSSAGEKVIVACKLGVAYCSKPRMVHAECTPY